MPAPQHFLLADMPDPERTGDVCCPRCWALVFTARRTARGMTLSCWHCDTHLGITVYLPAGVNVSGTAQRQFKLPSRRRRFPRRFRFIP